jgi:hypothetical protein
MATVSVSCGLCGEVFASGPLAVVSPITIQLARIQHEATEQHQRRARECGSALPERPS